MRPLPFVPQDKRKAAATKTIAHGPQQIEPLADWQHHSTNDTGALDQRRGDSKIPNSMASAVAHTRVDWKVIWAQRGFRYFFLAMFVSLFGSGLNFMAVSWYILSSTHSTVKVSLQVIVVTLPGLFVPFLGGVLIDRLDRRYLGVLLDAARGFVVLGTAYIAWHGHLALWNLYAMTLVTGIGSAVYWATVNALVQEVIPNNQFTGANAAVLVGVQSGMLIAGACAGLLYDSIGIAGILAIDGATYFVSAFCLYQVRRGYVSPRDRQRYPREYSEATEATALALRVRRKSRSGRSGIVAGGVCGPEGRIRIFEKRTARTCSGNHARGNDGRCGVRKRRVGFVGERYSGRRRARFGISGGRLGGGRHFRRICSEPAFASVANDFVCDFGGGVECRAFYGAVGYISRRSRAVQMIFGFCRAMSGVVAQSSLMSIVPRHFMGRTQSAIAILTTVLQLLMSFSLGWLAQSINIYAGFRCWA